MVGMALGVMVSGYRNPATDQTTPSATGSVQPGPLETTTTVGIPLAEVLPGFTGTAVLLTADTGGRTGLLRWRADQPTPEEIWLPARTVVPEPWGRYLAITTTNRYRPGDTLWVGTADYLEPFWYGTRSVVWSSSKPGRLAWASPDDLIRLSRVGDSEIVAVVRQGLAWGDPVWWVDDRLFLFDPGPGFLTAVDQAGAPLGRLEGVTGFVAGGSSYAALTTIRGAQVVSSDLSTMQPAPWRADCELGVFNPTTPVRLALLCATTDSRYRQVEVWEAPPADPFSYRMVYSQTLEGAVLPAWSADGLTLLIPMAEEGASTSRLLFLRLGEIPMGFTVEVKGVVRAAALLAP